MSKLDLKQILLCSTLLVGASAYSGAAFAQDVNPTIDEDEAEAILVADDEIEEVEESGDTVVVTGSRIRRDSFSSISPLQVISTELSQDVGLFDPSTILQRSEAASGQQIDATFNGFVLNNGPGAQTLNLRGLGADRTLLLINGRRVAPAGVEGAPSSPSINLLPGSLIERYDLLLDGASSIYGSDAVAGVGNVILKTDFDGFEVFGSGNLNEETSELERYTISGSWGKTGDRGFFGVGAEYDVREQISIADRSFLGGCETNLEVTESGEIRRLGISDRLIVEDRTPGVTVSDNECIVSGISGRIFLPFVDYGSVYFTPGRSNIGINDYSDSFFRGVDLDVDGDGIRDVDFQDVNVNGIDQFNFLSKQERVSLMSYGEYTLEGDANVTPFYEVLYTLAKISNDNTGQGQFFPYVPGANAFNPCNLANNDCDAAVAGLGGNPNFAGLSLPALPITAIRGDRNNFDVEQEQLRVVAGVRGDMPWMTAGPFSDWNFELSGVYSRSDGDSRRRGIRNDRTAFALGIDPTADFDGDGIVDNDGDGIADDYNRNDNQPPMLNGVSSIFGVATPCDAGGLANPELAAPDLIAGCVPVNLFAPSVLGSAIGDFATAAERDYLFGTRDFNTRYEQVILSGIINGTIGSTGAGPIGAAVGFEVRNDKISSNPDIVASNGLFFGFFSDGGAEGDKTIKEMFAEVSLPLIADYPLFKELQLDLSGRFTDEEFYGSAGTYSAKLGWRPVESLLLKASYGTSFRAPNLRENFLRAQSGFGSVFDPCAVPTDAFQPPANNPAGDLIYRADLDERDANVLAACLREGRDPTRVGLDSNVGNTFGSPGVEFTGGGSLDLNEETSDSFTTGFSFSQPFFESFDLDINVNYYDIEITDSVVEPGGQFIVNDCFVRDDGVRSAFCDRIEYDAIPTGRLLISDIDSGFINLDTDTVRGLDFNTRFGFDFTAFDEPFDFTMSVLANQLLERSNVFVDPVNGEEIRGDFEGTFGFPEWTGSLTAALDWRDYRFTWQTRYIGDVTEDEDGFDPFSDALDTQGTGFRGNTCQGPAAGDVLCRDVGFADEYFVHTMSARYNADTWTLRAGISNVLDEKPPLVSGGQGITQIANIPIGNGYDLNGREYFFSASKRF